MQQAQPLHIARPGIASMQEIASAKLLSASIAQIYRTAHTALI